MKSGTFGDNKRENYVRPKCMINGNEYYFDLMNSKEKTEQPETLKYLGQGVVILHKNNTKANPEDKLNHGHFWQIISKKELENSKKDKPLELEDLKELIGKEIYLVPKANSISRSSNLSNQIKKDILEKCGKSKFHLKMYGSFYILGYSANNYGYIPFRTEQEAFNYLEKEQFERDLKNKNFNGLSSDAVKRIKAIILETNPDFKFSDF